MSIDWGSAPDWVVAATAIIATIIARGQWRAMRDAENRSADASQQAVEVERAAMLRAIDAEFESEEMYASRKAIRALRNRIQERIGATNMDASEKLITEKCAAEFSRELTELWRKARTFDDVDVDTSQSEERIALDRYTEIMRLVNWFETVGYMCKRSLLPTADILNIYDAAIYPTMLNMTEHISRRREERPHPNPRFLENATWLGDRAFDHVNRMNALPVATLPNARLFDDQSSLLRMNAPDPGFPPAISTTDERYNSAV